MAFVVAVEMAWGPEALIPHTTFHQQQPNPASYLARLVHKEEDVYFSNRLS